VFSLSDHFFAHEKQNTCAHESNKPYGKKKKKKKKLKKSVTTEGQKKKKKKKIKRTCSITRSKHTAHEFASSGLTPGGAFGTTAAVDAVEASSLSMTMAASSILFIDEDTDDEAGKIAISSESSTTTASTKERFVPETLVDDDDGTRVPLLLLVLMMLLLLLEDIARTDARVGRLIVFRTLEFFLEHAKKKRNDDCADVRICNVNVFVAVAFGFGF
jgi:hypothetical protein